MKLKHWLMATALAVSFGVTTPTPAKADPITAAVVGFFGLTGTAAAVATFAVNATLAWGANKLLNRRKSSQAERQASVTTLSVGENPREMVFGQTITGGSLVDIWNHGGQYGTDKVTRCISLADHALDQLVGFFVDDQYFAFSGSGVQSGFNGKLTITFVNATAGGSAPLT